jgi:hypothetical protein
MKDIKQSLMENEQVREWLNVHENIMAEWYVEEAVRNDNITKQFEEDNILYIDKKTWSIITKRKIPIIVKGVDLCTRKFKLVNSVLRKGINVKLSTLLKLKEFIQYSVVDMIDQNRANPTYLQLLKNMNMFNRFDKLKVWLLSKVWDKRKLRKVRHKHYLGSKSIKKTNETN